MINFFVGTHHWKFCVHKFSICQYATHWHLQFGLSSISSLDTEAIDYIMKGYGVVSTKNKESYRMHPKWVGRTYGKYGKYIKEKDVVDLDRV